MTIEITVSLTETEARQLLTPDATLSLITEGAMRLTQLSHDRGTTLRFNLDVPTGSDPTGFAKTVLEAAGLQELTRFIKIRRAR